MRWKTYLFVGLILIVLGIIIFSNTFLINSNKLYLINPTKGLGKLFHITINPYQSNPRLDNYRVEIDNGLKISYKEQYSVTFIPIFILTNNNTLTWNEIPSNIEKDLWKIRVDDNHYKYGVNFNKLTTAQKNSIQFVVLHLVDSTGLTWDDIRLEGNTIIIKDKISISHDDILSTYTIPIINKTDIVIGNLSDNFIDNGDGTFNISFDPTITISEDTIITTSILTNITAETGNSNFTHLSIDNLTTPYDSLVGYWNFDGDAVNMLETTSYDFSENHYNGLLYGNATVNNTGCIYEAGNCLKLNGNLTDGEYLSYDYLYITGINYTTTEASLSFWASFQNGSPQTTLFYPSGSSFSPIIYVFPATTRTMRIYIQNVSGHTLWDYQSGALFNLDTWNYYAITYNSTGVYLYQDGSLVGSDTITTSEINFADFSNSKLYIGRHDSTDRYMNGSLDEIMIFNSTLTPTQVLNIYNNQISRYATQGTQTINSINISGDGTENRVNITLGDCETNLESNLSAQLGTYMGAGCTDDPGFYVEPDYYTCNAISGETACLEASDYCTWSGTCNTVTYPNCGVFQSQATCESAANPCTWKYQYNQSVINFQDCAITNYSFVGNPNDVSLRLTFYAGNSSDPFYSPLVIGNITLDSWYEEEETPPEEDSCNCPTSGTNWIINLTDYCIINMGCDIGNGNLSFINTGNFTCNTNINISNLNKSGLGIGSTLWVGSNCVLNLK